jgi:hypothetical protein
VAEEATVVSDAAWPLADESVLAAGWGAAVVSEFATGVAASEAGADDVVLLTGV